MALEMNKQSYDFFDNWFVAPSSLAEEGLKLMGKKQTNDAFRSGASGGSDGHGKRDQRHREQDASAPTPLELLPTLDERHSVASATI
jgi:hypothetical protein